MSKRCEDCRYAWYTAGTYWEPPDGGCTREEELAEMEKAGEIEDMTVVGDTVDCPLWEEILPEPEVNALDYLTLDEFFNEEGE